MSTGDHQYRNFPNQFYNQHLNFNKSYWEISQYELQKNVCHSLYPFPLLLQWYINKSCKKIVCIIVMESESFSIFYFFMFKCTFVLHTTALLLLSSVPLNASPTIQLLFFIHFPSIFYNPNERFFYFTNWKPHFCFFIFIFHFPFCTSLST